MFCIIFIVEATSRATGPSNSPAATTAPVESTVPPIHAPANTGFNPNFFIIKGIITIINEVNKIDIPTANVNSSFLALLALAAAIAAADALSEADYTAESWAAMKLEYEEAVDALAVAEYQADVDEATEHLTAAINALVKVDAGTPSGSEESDNTTEAGTSDTSVSDVKTGDADNMAVYSLAALLALAAGVAVVSRRRIKDVR